MATSGTSFYWIQPNEMSSLNGSVAGGAETGYTDDHLVDGRPGRPVRAATGSQTWTVTGTSMANQSIAVVGNHNVDAARAITFGGDFSASTAGPALPADGIPRNPWVEFTPATVASFTVAVASNTSALTIGLVVVGRKRTLERQLSIRPKFTHAFQTVRHDAEFSSVLPYSKNLASRRLEGTVILSDSGLADVLAWWDSTRGNTRLSVIVPDSSVQDAWIVEMSEPEYEPSKKNVNHVTLAFQEIPRSTF